MTRMEIERLKAAIRIEDVVRKYVMLTRRGNSYVGLCPFHDDRHPSLTVNPARKTYHCFACGAHGDVIDFIRRAENLGFEEAVGKLVVRPYEERHITPQAKPVPPPPPPCPEEQVRRNETFLSALLPYVTGCPELTPAYLDFEVGMSPVHTPHEWRMMSGRIVFPIRDEDGRLVGFAGRRASDDNTDAPKYLNSSDRDGYHKGSHLYGLHRAKEAIRREGFAIVTEGYKDAIAMHAAGYTNTVALGGTAMTDLQAALLSRYTDTLCLLLDGDRAGRDAARKITKEKKPCFAEIRVLTLSEDADPDSLFRHLGREGFCGVVRRLLSAPHYTEELLLAASLRFGDVPYVDKDGTCRLVELVYAVLMTEDLPFACEEYRDILCLLVSGQREAELSPQHRAITDALHAACDEHIRAEMKLLQERAVRRDHRICYVEELLWRYAEHSIWMKIRDEMKLLKSQTDNMEERADTFRRVAELRERKRDIARHLNRPGVLPSFVS